jgi:hypothetical protein
MNNKLHIVLAITAGFLGGTLSHYISQPALVSRELRAKSFVLVNDEGSPVSTFSFEGSRAKGTSGVKLIDQDGHEILSVGGRTYRPPATK